MTLTRADTIAIPTNQQLSSYPFPPPPPGRKPLPSLLALKCRNLGLDEEDVWRFVHLGLSFRCEIFA